MHDARNRHVVAERPREDSEPVPGAIAEHRVFAIPAFENLSHQNLSVAEVVKDVRGFDAELPPDRANRGVTVTVLGDDSQRSLENLLAARDALRISGSRHGFILTGGVKI